MRWTGFVLSSSNGLEKRPKLRFPGFDEPWERKTLSGLSKIVKGEQLPSTDVNPEGLFYHLNGGVSPSSRTDKFNVDANTISISEGGNSCGYVNWNPEPFFSGGHNYTLQKIVEEVSPYFLYEALKSKQTEIMALRVGSGLPNIQKKDIEKFPLYIPSKKEQNHIADFLRLVDSKVEEQSLLINNLKKYKRGLQNRFFFKRSHLSPKASEIDSHDVEPLGSVVHINPKTGSLPEAFIYIDLECVESGVLNSKKLISRNSAPSRAQRLLEEGDLLYQMVRPYQKNNYYFQKGFEYPTVASTGYAQIRCSEMDTQFIYEQLSSDYFAREAMLRSTGTGYPAINADDLAEIPIWVPPLNQQEKIGAALSFLGEKIEVHQKLLSALCSVKSSLLQQLFI